MPADAAASRPSRARHGVVGFALGLAFITYIDRACIGVLADDIRRDLGLSLTQMAWVFSAFTVAYAAFEVPSALWAERLGARRVLARIVTWWSVFTLTTAAATGFGSLLVIRFLFGAGEAGAWPNVTKVFARWVPASRRGLVQGIFFAGAHLAAGLTPMLVLLLSPLLGWRGVFLVFGLTGLVWVWAWLRWFRDDPREHPGVNEAELRLLPATPVSTQKPAAGVGGSMERNGGAIFRRKEIWLLSLVAFANSYGFYFVISWLPTFLRTLGLTSTSLAWYAGLPMLLAVPADLLGGVATDFLARRWGRRLGRALAGGVAYAVAAGAVLAASQAGHRPELAAICLGIAGAASMAALAASWAACIEIGGARAGVFSATMNTVGQVGGILSPLVLAWLVAGESTSEAWMRPLHVIAALYLAAAACWLFIDPSPAEDAARDGQAAP